MILKNLFAATIFLLGSGTAAFSQNADERVKQLMNEENWLEFYPVYTAVRDSLSPFIRDFGKALLDNFYNRPEMACTSIGKLLNESQNELGFENTCSMISLMASNLSKSGKNLEAADLLRDFCNQVEGRVDRALVEAFRQQERQYQELSASDLNQWNKPDKELRIPFFTDRGIALQGTLNGKKQQFLLDTGAGVNMVTPEVAKRCGLKRLDATAEVMGIKSGTGELALAEELKIGALVMRNVVFSVLDLTSGHPEADKQLKQLEVVIGIPVLNRLQEITLDFQKNELIIPAEPSASPFFAPNLCMTGSNQLCVATVFKKEKMGLLFDSGSDWSRLGYDYYREHRKELEGNARPDSTGVGGIGGVTKVKVYRLSNACLQLGGHESCIDSLDIIGQDVAGGIALDRKGVIGMNVIRSFASLTINLKEMFVTTTPWPVR